MFDNAKFLNHIGVLPFLLCAGTLSSHAQVQHVREQLDSLVSTIGTVEVVNGTQLKKGLVNNALDVLSGQAAGVNVGSNGMERMAMLNSVRVRGTTSIMVVV